MDYGVLVWLLLIIFFIAAQMIIPGFMNIKNIGNVLKIASFTGIAAIGQTLAILQGGIDMSISNVVTFANIIAAQIIMGKNENIALALVVVMLTGAICGVVNAAGIYFLRIPPMIMTLGLGTIIYGAAMIYSNGAPKGNAAPFLRYLVNEMAVGGAFPWIVVFWVIISGVVIIVLKKTTSGRKLYAVGNNPIAAKFSGINAGKIVFIVYIISGITAALTGMLLVGYTGTASARAGDVYSMDSIVAVVIGGTAITGGKGGYESTVAGAILLTVLSSLLTVVNISEAGRTIIQGIIILVMLLFYGREKKKF